MMADQQTDEFTDNDLLPCPAQLSAAETVVYQMIYEAADRGAVCPVNLDLEDAAGFSSCSMGSKTLQRLESKGYVLVERSQKARRVFVVASGKWTSWPAWHRSTSSRVDRGAHDPATLIRALDGIGFPTDGLADQVGSLAGLQRFENLLSKAIVLVHRRKIGVVLGTPAGLESGNE